MHCAGPFAKHAACMCRQDASPAQAVVLVALAAALGLAHALVGLLPVAPAAVLRDLAPGVLVACRVPAQPAKRLRRQQKALTTAAQSSPAPSGSAGALQDSLCLKLLLTQRFCCAQRLKAFRPVPRSVPTQNCGQLITPAIPPEGALLRKRSPLPSCSAVLSTAIFAEGP